jgi:hypothetical protein
MAKKESVMPITNLQFKHLAEESFLAKQMLALRYSDIKIKIVLAVVTLLFYDTLWDVVLTSLHHLASAAHILFEFFEHTLEVFLEHFFHFDPRNAEIATFYILLVIGGCGTFKLLKILAKWYVKTIEQLKNSWHHEKSKALQHYQSLPISGKIKTLSVCSASLFLLILWSIS